MRLMSRPQIAKFYQIPGNCMGRRRGGWVARYSDFYKLVDNCYVFKFKKIFEERHFQKNVFSQICQKMLKRPF
jgi:hypothetical protein